MSEEKDPRILESKDVTPFQIADTKYDNRNERDPAKQAQLVESIRARGILVRLMVVKEGDHYRVVDGQSRLNAAKALNMESVPVDVIAADDADAMLTGIIANNVRSGNSAYEIMQVALKLVQEKSLGAGAIARQLGVSEGYIKDLLAVSGLPQPLHEYLHAGALGVPAAKELLRLLTPQDQLIVGRDFAERHTSGPQASNIVLGYMVYKEQQANLPPQAAIAMATNDPLFPCELCGENKPMRGSTGKVYCGDCWRELMYLWEAQRHAKAQWSEHPKITPSPEGADTDFTISHEMRHGQTPPTPDTTAAIPSIRAIIEPP